MSLRRLSLTELTNMVMVRDPRTGRVLVQERVKSWKGLAFPGGHVEDGESFADSAVREIREETGLEIRRLESCGIIHWSDPRTFERYLVFLYRTEDFGGRLTERTEEGRVFWVRPEELSRYRLAENFDRYLPLFWGDTVREAFGSFDAQGKPVITYR